MAADDFGADPGAAKFVNIKFCKVGLVPSTVDHFVTDTGAAVSAIKD